MSAKIRWGIMGAGGILDSWICGAKQLDDVEIVGIASRTEKHAQEMAKRHGIPTVFKSYADLASCADIDAVYIPVPHTAHKELAMLAMERGKHVLVEKPISVTEKDAMEMVHCAKRNGVFLMEGVWTRFFPLYRTIEQLISNGVIGQVRALSAGLAFRLRDGMKEDRHYNPQLAGGGLLDMGVYGLHFAQMILGKSPVQLTGCAATRTDEYQYEVDEQCMIVGMYDNGELAHIYSAVRTLMDDTGYIYGTKGMVIIPRFWKPTIAMVRIASTGEEIELCEEGIPNSDAAYHDDGFQYEIRHVNDCIRNGMKESPLLPLATSAEIMRQCDCLRAMWGLKYPFES